MATINVRPTATTSSSNSNSNSITPPSPHKKNDPTATMKATDETLSTCNCDDSMTQDSSQHTNKSFQPSPMMSSTTASTATASSKLPPKQQLQQQSHRQREQHRPPVAAVRVDHYNNHKNNRNNDHTAQRGGVRQRLRDQEAKITSLLHSTTSNAHAEEETLWNLVKTLEADLKKTRDEKQELQNQLHERTAPGTASTSSTASTTEEETTTTNAATVTSNATFELQTELEQKNHALSVLQKRLDDTLARLVDTQLDLETHNLHFTDYAKVQFDIGQAALEDMNQLCQSPDKSARKLGRSSKRMMTTLLTDLEALGKRYQQQHVEHETTVATLTDQQAYWKRRAERLQQQLEATGENVPENEESPPPPAADAETSDCVRHEQVAAQEMVRQLQQQVQTLQEEKRQALLGQEAMQKEVTRLQKSIQQLQNVTVQQQQELEMVHRQAQAKSSKRRRGFFSKFGGKKNNKQPTAVTAESSFDLQAALAPIREESDRFDDIRARLDVLATRTAQQRQVQTQKTEEMKQELANLRLQDAKDSATRETELEIKLAMAEAKLAESEVQREQEQTEKRADMAKLEARILELESTC